MHFYLIDGYNLLHALRQSEGRDHPGQSLAPGELEDERRRLLDRLASFMGGTEDRAIVVFDSQRPRLQPGHKPSKNVEVYFGSFRRSADAIIEREAYALRNAESITVVTSDYALQMTVLLPNVIRRSSRQFVDDLQDHTTKVANRSDCTTIGHRVEDTLDQASIARLKALRERLEREPDTS